MADEERGITQEDIAEFTQKLEQWTQGLPEKEQALMQLITARARLIDPSNVIEANVQNSIESALHIVVDGIAKHYAPTAWVRVDPVWNRKNDELGEELEIISHSAIRLQGE